MVVDNRAMEIGQTTIQLQRIDASRNMARFYHLSIETDLFGDIVAVRRWGRVGRAGREMMQRHRSVLDASIEVARQARAKRHRGYTDV